MIRKINKFVTTGHVYNRDDVLRIRYIRVTNCTFKYKNVPDIYGERIKELPYHNCISIHILEGKHHTQEYL